MMFDVLWGKAGMMEVTKDGSILVLVCPDGSSAVEHKGVAYVISR